MKPALSNLETEEARRCILCGNDHPEPDKRFRRLLALTGPYDVLRCRNCDVAWLSPRPTAGAYEQIYSYESYFDGESALEDYTEVASSRNIHFIKRLERIASMLGGTGNIRLLDIGAATGEFVHEAIKMGFDAEGIEISEGARSQAKKLYGIDLLPGSLDDFTGETVYDVIHLNHVLEHLESPGDTLDRCYSMLARDGLLVIEVPQQFNNDLDRVKYLLGMKKPEFNIYSLHHIFFFSPKSVTTLVRKAGFEIESVATANPHRTPLQPLNMKNLLLRIFLGLSDRLHQGGNIIEVYGRKHV